MIADYVVVGSGLTGATIARMLRDAGKEVVVVESRPHVGGNVRDHVDRTTGVRIHTYGPHYFRTSSVKIWQLVNRFANFYSYHAEVATQVGGELERWPVSAEYVARECGEDWKPSFVGTPSNFEEASLAMMPREIYERFVRGYTEKQWGVPATSLSAALAGRFNVRVGEDRRLILHDFQGIPGLGYSHFMRELLRGIPVALGEDYLANRDRWQARKLLVFTGALDQFFGCDLGALKYRGQWRRHTEARIREGKLLQRCGQVNYPSPDVKEIRSLEWKHMESPMERLDSLHLRRSIVTYETPFTPTDRDDFEYPFPSDEMARLADAYRARLSSSGQRVLVCGRLGEYRYLDMDQAIARAMVHAERILERS